MKSVIVHGILLAVMLVYGYFSWTKEKPKPSVAGEVVMWNRPVSDLKAVEFATAERTLRLERRGEGANAYWWGLETKTTKKMKPQTPPPPPADPATPPPPPPPPEFEMVTETREFPIGEPGDTLLKDVARMRAIKSMGVVDEQKKKDYELVDTSKTISLVFNDGAKTLVLGGRVHGGSDRYILDVDSNKGFVMTGTLITPLEGGEGSLRPADLRAFNPKDAMQVQIAAGDKSKSVRRIKVKKPEPATPDPHAPPVTKPNQEIETWGEGAVADDIAANFIDKIEKLRPQSYDTKIDPKTLTNVLTLTYKSGSGKQLGTINVLKIEKPPEAGKTEPVIDYYLVTERTRVPALLPKLAVDRVLTDFETVFSGAPAAPPAAPAKPATPAPGTPAPAAPAPATPAPGTPAPAK
jgi:hypothetical protein